MAKVFKAGTISVGGDKIRLTAGQNGEFNFQSSTGSDLFSTAIYNSEVSSLAFHQNLDTTQRASDISSLDIVKDSEVSSLDAGITQRASDISSLDIVKDSEVSSLDAGVTQRASDISSLDIVKDSEVSSLDAGVTQRASDISSLDIVKDSEVSSLDAGITQRASDISSLDIVKDSEVSSLHASIGSLDSALQVTTANVNNNVHTQDFTWSALFGASHGFSSSTTVMVMVKAATGADLISCQLGGVSNTGFTVDFSENTGTGDTYDLVVMASN
jgi:hypothetical protein